MPEKSTPENKSSRTVDLSTGKKGKPKKKTPKVFAPVVQQTINLSTPKAEPTKGNALPSARKTVFPKPTKRKKENRRPCSQGNSLADLLDPETLAKLRGNG